MLLMRPNAISCPVENKTISLKRREVIILTRRALTKVFRFSDFNKLECVDKI